MGGRKIKFFTKIDTKNDNERKIKSRRKFTVAKLGQGKEQNWSSRGSKSLNFEIKHQNRSGLLSFLSKNIRIKFLIGKKNWLKYKQTKINLTTEFCIKTYLDSCDWRLRTRLNSLSGKILVFLH